MAQAQKAQKLMCGYANQYQALRAPTCGCMYCEAKWDQLGAKRTALKEIRIEKA